MARPRRILGNPPRRPDSGFVGRAEELAELSRALASTGRSALTQPASIHGLGGVGKTLLAIEFAHRRDEDYDTVIWLGAENSTTLATTFSDLAARLGLPESADPDPSVRTDAVLGWLETHDRWLLVFDNAERREDVEPYIPRQSTGHVLITSRNPDWLPLARPLKVRPLPRADSIRLLLGDPASGDPADADRLASALGDLPLALAQAAAYVRETGRSFSDYLTRFQSLQTDFDQSQGAEPGYGRTLVLTLELALNVLKPASGDSSSPAETLLSVCAFYAPDRIPHDLLSAEFPDPKTLDDAIRTLRHYSLVDTEPGAISVHRLVQRAVRLRMTSEEQSGVLRHAIQEINTRFPVESEDVRTWPACKKLLDHALHSTELASDLLPEDSTVARVLILMGSHLRAKHQLAKAEELFLRALSVRDRVHGPAHPSVAIALGHLGILAQLHGNLAEARRYYERALVIGESFYGPDHPRVVHAVGNLGSVALLQGDLAEAGRYYERALRIDESSHGPEHAKVALSLSNLGIVAVKKGDLAEARHYQERALRIEESFYGSGHPEIALTLSHLGFVSQLQGDLAEARLHFERSHEILLKYLGEDHPDTVNVQEALRTLNELTPGPKPLPTLVPPTTTVTPLAEVQPTLSEGNYIPPKVFISYSWDDDAHTEWVKQFATRLIKDGVDVTLDRWHAVLGDQLPAFMETAVRENDFVIIVCTPRFKQKSDQRGGGVGYEGDVMTAEVFTGGNQRKFIPVLRSGSWEEAAPSWLLGKYYVDLSADLESAYQHLLRTLHGALEHPPPPGPRPKFGIS